MFDLQIVGSVKEEPKLVRQYENSTVRELLLESIREEGVTDVICVDYASNQEFHEGDKVYIEGELRTVNTTNDRRDEKTYLFAKRIMPVNDDEFFIEKTNSAGVKYKANLNTATCGTAELIKDVVVKSEQSASMVVTTYRINGKRDNFYCMLWGKLVRIARSFSKGDEFELKGKVNGNAYYDAEGNIHTKLVLALYYVSRKG